MKIIELFILGHKNTVEIKNTVCDFYKIQSVSMTNIYKIIGLVQHTIVHYLKEIYSISPMSKLNSNENISV